MEAWIYTHAKPGSGKYFIIVVSFIALGCANSSNPVSPEMERNLSVFQDAIEIFGPTTDGDLDGYFHDVTLAQLCRVGDIGPGEAVEADHGCLAFTLHREDNDPSTPFKPVFRWLDSNNYDTNETPISYVCERDDDDPDNTAEYRAIAAKAIWNPLESNLDQYIYDDYIEVAVAYMVRKRPGITGDDNWDIEITILQWCKAFVPDQGDPDWWTHEPDDRITLNFPDAAYDDTDQFNPDIAYWHDEADIFVVYSSVNNEAANQVFLKYRRYDRSGNTISSEFQAQSTNPPHNGYDPSIDVGYIDWMGTHPWVVVAYTSQFHNEHMGYHVNISAWLAESPDTHRFTLFSLRHPEYGHRDAGLPCLDIAPYSNADHVGVLVYTQVLDSDGYGVKTENYIVRFLGQIADLDEFIPVGDDEDGFDTLYPSIAINKQQEEEDIFVSLAFMGQDTDVDLSDNWHPIVAKTRIFDYADPGNEPLGTTWTDVADSSGFYDTIIGNYNLSDIPFQNPGVASAIMTTNDDMFWAAWNDRIEMEPPPEQVWASYGNAGQ